MTASPGEIEPALRHWQTDDFAAELLSPSPKLELWCVVGSRCLCNQGSHQTLQPDPFAAFIRPNATRDIPW
jgi:hypothetical protein